MEKLVTPGRVRSRWRTEPCREPKHAQHVLNDAVKEARQLKHNYIGTEHLLLGLLYEKDCIATEVLAGLGLKLDEVRQDVLHFVENRKKNGAGGELKRLLLGFWGGLSESLILGEFC